jgi:hypothetical protein
MIGRFFLVAMPYTLLHQEVLEDEFPACERRGVGVVIGAPYQSGVLASGPMTGAKYNYLPAPPEILERVARIQAVCKRHGVPLAAAALQFPLGHPAVASVITGASKPEHVDRNVAAFRQPIPTDLWEQLKAEACCGGRRRRRRPSRSAQSRCSTSRGVISAPSSSVMVEMIPANDSDQRRLTSVAPMVATAVAMSGWNSP